MSVSLEIRPIFENFANAMKALGRQIDTTSYRAFRYFRVMRMLSDLDALEDAVRAAGIEVHHHSDPTVDVWAQIDRMRLRLDRESD